MPFSHRFYAVFITAAIAAAPNHIHAVPPNVTAFLNNESHNISEDNFLPSKQMPETLDFVRVIAANWRQVVKELPTIAPDGRRQSLIIVAGEFLPPGEYVAFIDALCELRSQGKLVPEALRFILWAHMVKADFLAFNFEQPEVAAVTAKLERQVTKDYPNDWRDYFAELKSGKLKQRAIGRREREGLDLPESFAANTSEPYQQLMGGSVKADMKLLARRPIEAVASIASTNRSRWSMIVAIIVVLGAVVGLIALLLRVKRRAKR